MRFQRNRRRLQLAALTNTFPGVFLQFGQTGPVQHGAGWIQSLHPRACHEVDAELKALGFLSIGPLSCRHWPGWVLRGFTHPREDSWCVHYLGLLLGSELDFVTEFTDGTWLTTTTNCVAPSPTQREGVGSIDDIFNSHLAHADKPRVPVGGQRELADAMRRFFRWQP